MAKMPTHIELTCDYRVLRRVMAFITHVAEKAPEIAESCPSDWRQLVSDITDQMQVRALKGGLPNFLIRLSGKDGDAALPRAVIMNGIELPAVLSASVEVNPNDVLSVTIRMAANKIESYRESDE